MDGLLNIRWGLESSLSGKLKDKAEDYFGEAVVGRGRLEWQKAEGYGWPEGEEISLSKDEHDLMGDSI